MASLAAGGITAVSRLKTQVPLVSLVGIGYARLAKVGIRVVLRQLRVPRLMSAIAGSHLSDETPVISSDDDATFGILHSRLRELSSPRLATSPRDRPRYPPTTPATSSIPEGLNPDVPGAWWSCATAGSTRPSGWTGSTNPSPANPSSQSRSPTPISSSRSAAPSPTYLAGAPNGSRTPVPTLTPPPPPATASPPTSQVTTPYGCRRSQICIASEAADYYLARPMESGRQCRSESLRNAVQESLISCCASRYNKVR